MAHDHASHISPANTDFSKAFAIGIGLNIIYVVAEAVFGLLAGSLALLADAGHNLSDVLGLVIAWGAVWLAKQPASGRKTYGYKRATVLASLANAILLLIAVGAIGWEAIRRLMEPAAAVQSSTVLWVAVAGIIVNGTTAFLFASGRKGDLNIRGAFLHMAADTAVTVGVLLSALVIGWTGWTWIDPVVSLVIAAVVLVSAWGLLTESVSLSLDAAPKTLDPEKVRLELQSRDDVADIHDFHIWALGTNETAMTAHIVCTDPSAGQALIRDVTHQMRDHFGIGHVTIQIETRTTADHCPLRPAAVV